MKRTMIITMKTIKAWDAFTKIDAEGARNMTKAEKVIEHLTFSQKINKDDVTIKERVGGMFEKLSIKENIKTAMKKYGAMEGIDYELQTI